MESQNGQVAEFEKLEVQARGTNHRITPKDFTITGLCLAMEAPEATICFHSAVYFKIVWWFSTRGMWHEI
jgi:hypothetical protein